MVEECFDTRHHWFPTSCQGWSAVPKNPASAVHVVVQLLLLLSPDFMEERSTEKSFWAPNFAFQKKGNYNTQGKEANQKSLGT